VPGPISSPASVSQSIDEPGRADRQDARSFVTWSRALFAPLAIAVGYYVGARLGFALTLAPVPVSTLWPPNAILLAGLVLTRRRAWPLVLAFVFVAHLGVQFQSGVPVGMVLCWFISNCTEALLGAFLLRRYGNPVRSFDTVHGTAIFAGAALTATVVSSFIDAGFVVFNGWGTADYWTIWRTRSLSNVLATLTLVPVLLTTADRLRRGGRVGWRRLTEAALLFVSLAAVCWPVFALHATGPGALPALLYAPLPLLVAAALRFGPWGASSSMLACALIAISGAARGQGPFVSQAPASNALAIQLFLIVAWGLVMSLAAVMRERSLAEAKTRMAEEELAVAIDAAQLGRWDWDIASQSLTWSANTRAMYGLSPDEPVSSATLDRLVHPDDRAILSTAGTEAMRGRPIDVEFRIVLPDGRIRWIHSRGRTICNELGQPVRMVGVKVDVTERKAAEQRLHAEQRRLAHSAHVSVAGELSSVLAHELNQPLAAILANASAARRFLRRDPPDLREIGDILEAIAEDNRRAAGVVARVGTLLKRDHVSMKPLDINDVVAGVLGLVHGDVIARGVSLTRRFGRDLPPVFGDVRQLQEVLLNLVANACDAMDPMPAGTRRLAVSTAADRQGGVRVTVADTGPGVPRGRVDEIFEPFVTTKPQRLGMGLAICRSIVSSHDGVLTVEKQAEAGAAFSVTLPAFAGNARVASPEERTPAEV
jgi:PAS domain S-box-containing protein